MSTSLSLGIAEARAEADWLCSVVADHAERLKAAAFKREFRLSTASFRLHAKDRNTLYRVSGQFEWFLKMTPAGSAEVGREQLGAATIAEVLCTRPEYCGAAVVRVGTNPSYVLASNVPGRPLSRLLVTDVWQPGNETTAALEDAFANLGSTLALLHSRARVNGDMPPATKRPFDSLRTAATRLRGSDALIGAIAECLTRHEQRTLPSGFVHGNMRLDNVMVSGGRIGFIDLEHCGIGAFYHDVSRPIAQLLLTRAAIVFPRRRVTACLRAFLRQYSAGHSYDPAVLNDFVFARLAKYCADNRRRYVPQCIGGVPIVASRLEALSLAIERGGLKGAVPELRDHLCRR